MSRALITGWFGFEYMGATAGDIQTALLTRDWLADLGIPSDLAVMPPFEGDVRLDQVDPDRYTHFVFACGPMGECEMTTDLLRQFDHCTRIGLNLTMLQDIDEWNPFDILLERDSNECTRADMAFQVAAPRVPVVGLVLVHRQEEYGELGQHDQVKMALDAVLAERDAAVLPIDTRLDVNAGGLRSSAEVEAMIARCDLVLTTRLHGTVLSLKNGVPVVVVDPIAGGAKVIQQARYLQWPCRFTPEDLDHDALLKALDWCLGEEARQAVVDCRQRATRHLRVQREEFHRLVSQASASPPRAE